MVNDEAVAIELNDVGVVFSDVTGLSEPSPGIAFLEGERLLTGEAARAFWRTAPTRAHASFWDDLSQDPLPRPLGPALATADLVHAQLSSLWERVARTSAAAVVALPSNFERTQMGLLLGILQSIPIPVTAFVDAAVLSAASAPEQAESVVHVDLRLHRSVVTRVSRKEKWVRESVDVVEGCGWLSLLESWANVIADRFIRTTRFDPLHAAADEQRLYDLLPGCLSTLATEEEVEIEIGPPADGHRIVIPRKEMMQASSQQLGTLFSRIKSHVETAEDALCQITSRLSACPGLEARAREALPCRLSALPQGFAAIRARQEAAALSGADGRVPFIAAMRGAEAGPVPGESAHGS